MLHSLIAVNAPLTEKPSPQSYSLNGVEVTTAMIAIGLAIVSWLRSEFKSKSAAADAEAALIKSLQQELTDKDEEIDKQRILIWKLEKEVRMLRQAMEYSGGPFQSSGERISN
ncbi:hypothetical protein NIES2119_08115 [[Phormidium ambiguum] IAM M-71]|uniref:Uncharacterized protein n=1 Tax=[Phormidium ambiguum] IAM M-71 TaxID=454136 RepID=A0A1U7IP65_9CYAN|nr:hypothetical protein [Phormidium ambiguum]OKH39085.1 hypothetical protein NIES2119_08115 [Phormidium ambiguum IAM M-71]